MKAENINILQLIKIIEKNKISKLGKGYVMRCLFHEEKTPSCSISVKTKEYHCFSCSKHGSIEEINFKVSEIK